MERVNLLEETINAIDSNDLSNVYEVAMTKEAKAMLEEIKGALDSYIQQKLRGRAEEYRLRVGDYRVLYVVDDATQVVEVIAIRHRREAYR